MRIARAAIKYEGRVYTIPRPGRHVDVARAMFDVHKVQAPISGAVPGFVLDDHRFVDSHDALGIALRSGQVGPDKAGEMGLDSSDVW